MKKLVSPNGVTVEVDDELAAKLGPGWKPAQAKTTKTAETGK